MNNEIRVINFVPGLGSGGIGILMREWYNRKDKNVVFDIATIGKGMAYEVLKRNGCKIYEFDPLTSVGFIKYTKQAYQIIKSGNYNIVHSHVGMVSCFIFIAALFARIKTRILHAHGTKYNKDNGKAFNSIVTKTLMKCSTFFATDYVACSYEAAKYLFGKRKAKNKAIIIKNGIDLDRFTFEHKEHNEKKIIGYIARIEESKNHLFLIEVLRKIVDDRKDVELLLIGDGDPSSIMEKARAVGVEDHVTLLPAQNDIERYYHKMDVFAFPSLYEGLGIVAIEAQACGTPVLLSPGIPNEAVLSPLAKKIELDENIWAKEIEYLFDHPISIDVKHNIIAAGFDINTCTNKLMVVYSGRADK